jgi:hypothetical protein
VHIEFLVEEPSAEAALTELLPRCIMGDATWTIHVYQGKQDLLSKLPDRLKGYARWLPTDWHIVVLLDNDRGDCHRLKYDLEQAAVQAGLSTPSNKKPDGRFQVINRIAMEELEAWFLGDVEALRKAYPGIPRSLHRKARYRDPDCITGGTWEALEYLLRRAGYFKEGLRKIEAARNIAREMDPARNRSRSFCCFRDAMAGLTSIS